LKPEKSISKISPSRSGVLKEFNRNDASRRYAEDAAMAPKTLRRGTIQESLRRATTGFSKADASMGYMHGLIAKRPRSASGSVKCYARETAGGGS